MIVDDHDLVRLGIKRILSEINGIKVVGEANSGENAVQMAKEKTPNVVLMDVKMPGMGGIEATRRVLRQDPDIKVLAVSSCDDEPFPTRLLQAGATGYITKGCAPDEMAHAIRAVHVGQRYISPAIAEQLAIRHLSKKEASPFDILSDRELQVMMMITQGYKVQDISEQLKLSPKTVNSYRYRLFEKLSIHNDVELTHLAIRHGMLSEENLQIPALKAIRDVQVSTEVTEASNSDAPISPEED